MVTYVSGCYSSYVPFIQPIGDNKVVWWSQQTFDQYGLFHKLQPTRKQKPNWKKQSLVRILRNDEYDLAYYSDVIIGAMVPQITSLTIVYSSVYSGADQRKH